MKTRHKIALAALAQRAVVAGRRLTGARNAVTRVNRKGIEWQLDLREGIDFAIWLLGSFEPETVRCYRRLVRPGALVLDIGANIGAHTLHLAEAVGAEGRVLAFEPTDYAFAKLSQNCALNPHLQSRIRLFQAMLVSRDGPAETPRLYSSWPLQRDGDLHAQHQGRLMSTSSARAATLDTALREAGIGRVDFVKLDIDGFECGMLEGAKSTLTRDHPVILMELAPYALEEQGDSLERLVGKLDALGYGLTDLSGRRSLPMNAALLDEMIAPGASLNVLAQPR